MGKILSRMFPALFSNPEEEAFKRKMRIQSSLRKFEQEVKKQDGFIRQYLVQAADYKRTGDAANYGKARKALAFTFGYRTRAQRALHSLQIFNTMSNQMAAYKDFCLAVNDIAQSMGGAMSAKDVMAAQENLQKGMDHAKATEELMDQVLDSFDASFEALPAGEAAEKEFADGGLDRMIEQMISAKDNLTEDRISQLLNAGTGA